MMLYRTIHFRNLSASSVKFYARGNFLTYTIWRVDWPFHMQHHLLILYKPNKVIVTPKLHYLRPLWTLLEYLHACDWSPSTSIRSCFSGPITCFNLGPLNGSPVLIHIAKSNWTIIGSLWTVISSINLSWLRQEKIWSKRTLLSVIIFMSMLRAIGMVNQSACHNTWTIA